MGNSTHTVSLIKHTVCTPLTSDMSVRDTMAKMSFSFCEISSSNLVKHPGSVDVSARHACEFSCQEQQLLAMMQ